MWKCRQLKPDNPESGFTPPPNYKVKKMRFNKNYLANMFMPNTKINLVGGFTLIEVLVAMSLSMILFGALYGVYITSYQSYRKNVARAEINQNGRISLERISRDLRQTPSIVTSLPPTDTDDLNPPATNIKFQDGHDTSRIQYIEYTLQGTELHRALTHYCFSASPESCATTSWVAWNAVDALGFAPNSSTDEDVVKADKIESLKFFGSPTVTVDLATTDNRGASSNLKTEVYCRNI